MKVICTVCGNEYDCGSFCGMEGDGICTSVIPGVCDEARIGLCSAECSEVYPDYLDLNKDLDWALKIAAILLILPFIWGG